ncbi:tRNA synthetases class I family protein [Babesia bovis T2Bo]|uniref:isoleucine--tRNA ligase n=1 Tax=Babesia bovis TaxID=5865 RepID=A7AUB6_BABBO|nr:tRNA synthetases class I family protein [Babesia bovis T2Bo]EDO06527.1 tRNA synthetases class I family protein [Babesia bovis T2Bo]|eukprot:XP_001610095.1 tRNA synthetases class I protein superfamily [Babesia bovis T2Bo]
MLLRLQAIACLALVIPLAVLSFRRRDNGSQLHRGFHPFYTLCLKDNINRYNNGSHLYSVSIDQEYVKNNDEIKKTLNLPQNIWPKRSNFFKANIERQIRIQSFWKHYDVYRLLLERRLAYFGNKEFNDSRVTQKTCIILDGPPYANGNAHYGHFLNKTIKDVLLRASLLDGKLALLLPGWDCHGIPIESKVLQNTGYHPGQSRTDITETGLPLAVDIRQKCSQVATKSIEAQKKVFESAGVWALWKDFYATYHFYYEQQVMEAFEKLLQSNLIYRARCPQHYSTQSQSVLSYAELQTKQLDTLTALVGFELVDNTDVLRALDFHRPLAEVRLVCWTTTPWTLPANRGVLINAITDYNLYYRDGILYVMNNNENFGIFSEKHYVGTLSGSIFVGKEIINPVTGAIYKVHDHCGVIEDKGTGIVHAAPAHGMVDFKILSNYPGFTIHDGYVNDPNAITNVIDENERYYPGVHPLLDNKLIKEVDTECLRKVLGTSLLHTEVQNLPVDVDNRFGNRTHVRLTKQWFLSLLQRKACIPKLDEMKIYPEGAKNYLKKIIANRAQDWCISRQRIWGIPIPIAFVDVDALDDPELAKLYNIDYHVPGTAQGEYCLKVNVDSLPHYELGDRVFRKLNYKADSLDIWFESALANRVTINRLREILLTMAKNVAPQQNYEFRELIPEYAIEGQDQFRGWYQSSILVNYLLQNDTKCLLAKGIITHGFVNDDSGNKLSKRNQPSETQDTVNLDNMKHTTTDNIDQDGTDAPLTGPSNKKLTHKQQIDIPNVAKAGLDKMLGMEYYEDTELIELDEPQSLGADVLRLWACSNDFKRKDIQLNNSNISEAVDLAKKIANFFKYAIGVTHDCKIKSDTCRLRLDYFNALDIYMLKLSYDLVYTARKYFKEGCLHKVVRELEIFLTRFSNIYVSYCKDRLYCDVKHGWSRTCAQIIIKKIMRNVLDVVAPIMPHMAEDVYQTIHNVTMPQKRKDMANIKSVFGKRWMKMPNYLSKVDVNTAIGTLLDLRNLVNKLRPQRDDKELIILCDSDATISQMLNVETTAKVDLRLLLGVANVRILPKSRDYVPPETSIKGNGYEIWLVETDYSKCQRCWLYRQEVTQGFCERCASICTSPPDYDMPMDSTDTSDQETVEEEVDCAMLDDNDGTIEDEEYFDE